MDKTTIAISKETKDRLDKADTKGHSYNDIIIDLLDAKEINVKVQKTDGNIIWRFFKS